MKMATHRIGDLVVLAVRLRWRLSTNRLARRGKRTRRIVLVAAAAYTVFTIVMLGSARYSTDAVAANTLVIAMASMAMGWVFGPVLVGGVDETIDPTRLALFPLSGTERFVIQLSAALSGLGPLAASIGLVVGLTVGHAGAGPGLVFVPLAAAIAIALMVGSARTLAATLAVAQRSRVGRDLAVLLAALAGGSVLVMAQLSRNIADLGAGAVADALGWLPWVWPAHAIHATRIGAYGSALAWLAASSAVMVVAQLCWIRLSNVLLEVGERGPLRRPRSDRQVLNGAASPFGAALSRQWIYLRRSPNNRVGLIFGTVFGVAFSLLQIMQRGAGNGTAAAFGTLLAMLANLGSTSNVLGFDVGSLWIEVLAGGRLRSQLIARQLSALPNLLIPTWTAGLVVGAWTGQWVTVALVALLAVPVALHVLTFGTITSVVLPAALPDMDNPFGNRQGNESRVTRVIGIAFGGLAAISVLAMPMMVFAVRTLGTPTQWLVPLGGLIWSGGLLAITAAWAGHRLSGREPDLIERLAPRALSA